jgi:hypothetical protein
VNYKSARREIKEDISLEIDNRFVNSTEASQCGLTTTPRLWCFWFWAATRKRASSRYHLRDKDGGKTSTNRHCIVGRVTERSIGQSTDQVSIFGRGKIVFFCLRRLESSGRANQPPTPVGTGEWGKDPVRTAQ